MHKIALFFYRKIAKISQR